MSTRLQIILILLVLIMILVVVRRIRSKKLLLQYTLSWMMLLAMLLLVACIPNLLKGISSLLGIASPMNMVFFVGFCFTLLIIFDLTQAVSKMSQQIKDLTQKVALMEKEKEEEKK